MAGAAPVQLLTGGAATPAPRSADSSSYPGSFENVRQVSIRDESIRLGQFLKLAGMADSGSDGKRLLEAGDVRVNGAPESRRGRQLHPGDVVEAAGDRARIVVTNPGPDPDN